MTIKRGVKPSDIKDAAGILKLRLMDEFRADVLELEKGDGSKGEGRLDPSPFNPLAFKYAFYEHLFKLWMMARERGDIL